MKQFKQILLTSILLLCVSLVFSQVKEHSKAAKISITKQPVSLQTKNFQQSAVQAGAVFTFPAGFRELKAPENEDYSFDYAMELPGKEFEIWFQVRSQKENYISYEKNKADKSTRLENPDSIYLSIGSANAIALSGDRNYFVRNIPQSVTSRYHADAGKSYLLNLLDQAVTKHYKYALLITLQKAHTGTIMAVCFANEKGPEFFKNIDKASNCIKFK